MNELVVCTSWLTLRARKAMIFTTQAQPPPTRRGEMTITVLLHTLVCWFHPCQYHDADTDAHLQAVARAFHANRWIFANRHVPLDGSHHIDTAGPKCRVTSRYDILCGMVLHCRVVTLALLYIRNVHAISFSLCPESGRLRAHRLRSAQLRLSSSSAQLSSAQLSSTQLSSAQLNSTQRNSTQLNSTQLNSTQLSSAQLSSAQLSSAHLTSPQLSSAQLSSAQLSSAHVVGNRTSLFDTIIIAMARLAMFCRWPSRSRHQWCDLPETVPTSGRPTTLASNPDWHPRLTQFV